MSQPNGLRALRRERGWSQEHLATLSGLSERTIQRAERGDTPSLDTLGALASSFDLSSAQMREILSAPEEAPTMKTQNQAETTQSQSAPATEPVLTAPRKRLLIAGAVYLFVLTWLGVMQSFAGWDPELIPYVALTGGGLLASYAFFQFGGDEKKDE